MSQEPASGWTEGDSETYRKLVAVAVPARDEQIAALLTLLPFAKDAPFRAVEAGCGEGVLAEALLECYPEASVLALDGSQSMLESAGRRLRRFGDRARVEAFDLASKDWRQLIDGAGCVLSSLCVHHLTADGKRRFFADAAARLATPGTLLIADVLAPANETAAAYFAGTYDRVAEAQSLAVTGSRELFDLFQAERWNGFRYPDDSEYPSPLSDQLTWLREAGFETVDCFWLHSGFAVFGGYKGQATPGARLSYDEALKVARAALDLKP